MEFVEILKEVMTELEINQTQLAKEIGIKQSQVSEWLKGKSKPGYDNIKLMCSKLQVPAERILGIEE